MFTTSIDISQELKNIISLKAIPGNSNYTMPDGTLMMTMEALLYNRDPSYKIQVNILDNPKIEIIKDSSIYRFYWFRTVEELKDPDKFISKSKNQFKEIISLPTHEMFLKDKLKQEVYLRVAPAENTVFIFAEIRLKTWHAVQFLIPKFFPIFKEKPLTAEEKDFLLTLTQPDQQKYRNKLNELINTDSFREHILINQLDKFEKRLYKVRIDKAQDLVSKLDNEIDDLLERYKKACEQQLNAKATLYGLTTMDKEQPEHTELQEYLLNNKHICNLTINDSMMSFITKTELVPYFIDDWELFTSKKSFFDSVLTGKFSCKDAKLLLDAIFGEKHCLKLKMCGYFQMDYYGTSVETRSNYEYGLKDYIPNPHFQMHHCISENRPIILEQLRNGDVIGAFECAIIATQRVNIHEDFTFKPFLTIILNSEAKCLVGKDGTDMTPQEAVKYLKEAQNNGQ